MKLFVLTTIFRFGWHACVGNAVLLTTQFPSHPLYADFPLYLRPPLAEERAHIPSMTISTRTRVSCRRFRMSRDGLAAPTRAACDSARTILPEFITAAKSMLVYPYDDFKPEHPSARPTNKKRRRKRRFATSTGILDFNWNFDNPASPIAPSWLHTSIRTLSLGFFLGSFLSYPFDIRDQRRARPTWALYSPAAGKKCSFVTKQINWLAPRGSQRATKTMCAALLKTIRSARCVGASVAIRLFRSLYFSDIPPRLKKPLRILREIKEGAPTADEYLASSFRHYIFPVSWSLSGQAQYCLCIFTPRVGSAHYFSLPWATFSSGNVLRDPAL